MQSTLEIELARAIRISDVLDILKHHPDLSSEDIARMICEHMPTSISSNDIIINQPYEQ